MTIPHRGEAPAASRYTCKSLEMLTSLGAYIMAAGQLRGVSSTFSAW